MSGSNDYAFKQDTLNTLMHMKVLASNANPDAQSRVVAEYRLAKLYSEKSSPSLNLMQAAADKGLTNAMLDLSLVYAKNGKPDGLKEAAALIIKIFASSDSFIKDQARAVVKNNPLLEGEIAKQMNPVSLGRSFAGFFAPEANKAEQPDLPETPSFQL